MAIVTATCRYRVEGTKFDRVTITTDAQFSDSDWVAPTHFLRMLGIISKSEMAHEISSKSPVSPDIPRWVHEYDIKKMCTDDGY